MSRHEELGDALNAGRVAQDAAHNYYSFKLLQSKLEAQGIQKGSALYQRVLGSRSEKEALELHILATIQGNEYGESSANYSQLVDLTGSRDKLTMAKFLAEKVYEREATKMILNRFAPPPEVAGSRDPVTLQNLTGFQALINAPRGVGLTFGSGRLSGTVVARAIEAAAAGAAAPAAAAGGE